ncbi:MAG: Spo0B domain-containing protein [Syntrophomonas sp.]|nr:Spo0B domain-containing protein [Syntrophomonas sp.]
MEAAKVANLLRRVRHDFANHLQVIGGYLDLDQPERVKDYLRAVMEKMSSERVLFEALKPEAALYFYEQLNKAYDMGITLHYEDLNIVSWEILKEYDEPCHSMAALRQEKVESDEDKMVYLSVYEDEQGVEMFFTYAGWGQVPKRIRITRSE